MTTGVWVAMVAICDTAAIVVTMIGAGVTDGCRRIPVPAHRLTPLRQSWMQIYQVMVVVVVFLLVVVHVVVDSCRYLEETLFLYCWTLLLLLLLMLLLLLFCLVLSSWDFVVQWIVFAVSSCVCI